MRILLIEDESEIVRFLTLELQHEGYQTESCADGRSGLERALNGAFDLVLLDVMLPQLNGIEVLRRLRKESSVPVILVTGPAQEREMAAALAEIAALAGATDRPTVAYRIEDFE